MRQRIFVIHRVAFNLFLKLLTQIEVLLGIIILLAFRELMFLEVVILLGAGFIHMIVHVIVF